MSRPTVHVVPWGDGEHWAVIVHQTRRIWFDFDRKHFGWRIAAYNQIAWALWPLFKHFKGGDEGHDGLEGTS